MISSRLQDLCEVVDCEHKTAPEAAAGSKYAYSVGTPALRGRNIDFSQAKPVDRPTYEAWSRRAELRTGDIILAREAPVGGVGYVDGARKVCLGQRTVLIRTISTGLDSRFLFFALRSPEVQNWMLDRSTGSTVAHINVADVRRLPIPFLPPLAEQRRIAGVLGALDDLIETNQRLIGSVREFSSLRYRQMRRSAQGLIRLGDVIDVNSAQTKVQLSGTLTYLDIASVGDGSITWPDPIAWTDAPSRARRLASVGSTIWATVRPNRRAHALLTHAPENLVISTGLAVLSPKILGPAEIFAATDEQSFVDYLMTRADGSAYPAVRASAFQDAEVALLGTEASARFESELWPLWQFAGELTRECETLQRTRDELLPLLLSGRVSVREVAA
jgi:type I restriction enzyme S subunit